MSINMMYIKAPCMCHLSVIEVLTIASQYSHESILVAIYDLDNAGVQITIKCSSLLKLLIQLLTTTEIHSRCFSKSSNYGSSR